MIRSHVSTAAARAFATKGSIDLTACELLGRGGLAVQPIQSTQEFLPRQFGRSLGAELLPGPAIQSLHQDPDERTGPEPQRLHDVLSVQQTWGRRFTTGLSETH